MDIRRFFAPVVLVFLVGVSTGACASGTVVEKEHFPARSATTHERDVCLASFDESLCSRPPHSVRAECYSLSLANKWEPTRICVTAEQYASVNLGDSYPPALEAGER